MSTQTNHPFHMVEKSPWPLTASMSTMMLTMGLLKWMHMNSHNMLVLGLSLIIISSMQWWRDIHRESTFQGLHTKKVVNGLQWGMILFIISEILFFFSFFWAFFHSSLNPTLEVGNIWPPISTQPFSPFQIPLLNTMILLSSGTTVTWTHHSIIEKNFTEAKQSLMITIMLGFYFTILQVMEYLEASFTIADSIYGSTFFVATGFHGLHVIIGSLFLTTMLLRHMKGHFSNKHHFGLEASIWYWHFVDVVWLFLYTFMYWWSS